MHDDAVQMMHAAPRSSERENNIITNRYILTLVYTKVLILTILAILIIITII